jgi:hypothetical protein
MKKFYLGTLLVILSLFVEGGEAKPLLQKRTQTKPPLGYAKEEVEWVVPAFNTSNYVPYSKYLNRKIWNLVADYMMPEDHPIKEELDLIFSKSRVFCDFDSMKAAGFANAKPQHNTRLIVTRHPDFPGYVFKVYLDKQSYFHKIPEYENWVKRVKGARAIKKSIKKHDYGHLFKVPQKWLYLLPDNPSPPQNYLRKLFILVEEDMDIYNGTENKLMWGSDVITTELLDAFFTVLCDVFLQDTTTGNCNFAHDGRIAFVDTESCFKKTIKHEQIMRFLSPAMKKHWLNLFYKKGILSSLGTISHKDKLTIKRHRIL